MTMPMGVLAVGIATMVVFGYLVIIWWMDRYEREPFWLVLVTFLWGGLGGTFLGCVLSLMMSVPLMFVVPEIYMDLYTAVVVAPLAEEFTKGLIFLVLILTPYVDNETDGLIYGAATGLGFAAVENLLYFVATAMADPEALMYVIVARTMFTALVHTISSALLGFTIGYVRHRRLWPRLWLLPILGFVLAVANHALWNLVAVVSGSGLIDGEVGALGIGIALVVVMSLVMFGITQLSLFREHKIIEKYLSEEAGQGVLPQDHAAVIPYWRKRRRGDWLSPSIPRDAYVQAATMLAFRLYQLETSAPAYRTKYQGDVERYRQEVRGYLQEANRFR